MLLYDFWTIIIIWNVYSNFADELPYVELNIKFKLIDLPFFHVNSFLNFSRDLPHVYNFPPIINRAYEYVVLMICKIRIFKHLRPISAKYLGVIVRTPAQFKAFNLLPTALFNIQCCIVRTPKIAQSFSNWHQNISRDPIHRIKTKKSFFCSWGLLLTDWNKGKLRVNV